MKYSQLSTKVNKKFKEEKSINATLLQRGGFIHQTMAGVYSLLPLGWRVLQKIENIVREEMDKIAVEVLMPSLSPKDLWEATNRLHKVDVLFKASGGNEKSLARNDAEYILNFTHEELITPIAKQFNQSYKDFPFAYYQIQAKYRNEPRAKSGLLRGREFRMKDAYSFHTSEEDLLDYYHNVAKPAYTETFKRLGLGEDTVVALASGGDFTKEFSHEFQTKCESGEDVIFYSKAKDVYYNREVAPSKAKRFEQDKEMREKQDVFGEHVTGMEELVKFLNVPDHKCVKTLIYEADGKVVVAAVRGDYDVDEGKLRKVLNISELKLASEETVKNTTGAEIGYAGIINLKDGVTQVFDESISDLVNFECGTNKTNYHTINLNWERDLARPEKYYDIKVTKEGDLDPEDNEPYTHFKASEVGNIFPLNTKYSDAFDYKYTDKDGQMKDVYMGCYGIGTTRLMGLIAEKYNDAKGLMWPKQVAPFQVHLIGLNLDQEDIKNRAEGIYKELISKGVEVLYDEREDVTAGEKFAEADAIGIPVRVVVSKRTEDKVEVKRRSEESSELVGVEEIGKFL